MSAHLENELVGLVARIENLEQRQGMQHIINEAIAISVPDDPPTREEFARLLAVVEKQQAQIEELNEIVGELMPNVEA